MKTIKLWIARDKKPIKLKIIETWCFQYKPILNDFGHYVAKSSSKAFKIFNYFDLQPGDLKQIEMRIIE